MLHSSLTEENVKKAATILIIGEKYENDEDWLLKANLDSLKEKRDTLCKTFAIKCMPSENLRINNIISKNKTEHGTDLGK